MSVTLWRQINVQLNPFTSADSIQYCSHKNTQRKMSCTSLVSSTIPGKVLIELFPRRKREEASVPTLTCTPPFPPPLIPSFSPSPMLTLVRKKSRG